MFIKELVAKSGRNPDQFALHSLSIGETTTLAAGGDIWGRLMKREGKWKSDAYEGYTRNNIDDSRRVLRKIVLASEGRERQMGEGTVRCKK